MTAPYKCANDHVGQRGPDGSCQQCRREAAQRRNATLRPLARRGSPSIDFTTIAEVLYAAAPKSLAEADAREARKQATLERRAAARMKDHA